MECYCKSCSKLRDMKLRLIMLCVVDFILIVLVNTIPWTDSHDLRRAASTLIGCVLGWFIGSGLADYQDEKKRADQQRKINNIWPQ